MFTTAPSALSTITAPPDLSAISDPTLTVLFKSLSKREEVTRVKALEGLLDKLSASSSSAVVEEGVLSAWTRLFPPLCIDASPRVRRLSFSVLGAVGSAAGRRLARHMSALVGPWLCGTFDNDRAAARAASDAAESVFRTPEKVRSAWTVFGKVVLAFCTETVAREEVWTLSDERWCNSEDAEAKWARTTAVCILAVARMLREGEGVGEGEGEVDGFAEFLKEKRLWMAAFHTDAFLRRAVFQLLLAALEKRPELVRDNLDMIATAVVVKAAALKSQAGSAGVYMEALEALTKHFPECWTVAKAKKKSPPLAQLLAFVELGSHSAPPSYWEQLTAVVRVIPEDVLADSEKTAKSVANAVLAGIKAGPEPRSHILAAWGCFLDVCLRFLEMRQLETYIVEELLLPIYTGYLAGGNNGERTFVSREDAVAAAVCGSGLVRLQRANADVTDMLLGQMWAKVEVFVVGIVRADQEVKVKRCAEAWVKLVVGVLKALPNDGTVYATVVKSNVVILGELIKSLVATNGKSTGAAVFFEALLSKVGKEILSDDSARQLVNDFFSDKLVAIISPDTIESLLSAFVSYGAGTPDGFDDAWKKTVRAVLMSPELSKEKKEDAIVLLLNSAASVGPVQELDGYVVNKMRAALPEHAAGAWRLVKETLRSTSNVITQDTTTKILVELMEGVDLDAPRVLDAVAGTNPHRLMPFINSDHGKELLSKLLVLANSPDRAISSSAARLRSAIDAAVDSDGVGRLTDITVGSICNSVLEPTSEHLDIDYLAAKAASLVKGVPKETADMLVAKLLFSEEEWESAIAPHPRKVNSLSLAISNPLGGAIFLVGDDATEKGGEAFWDSEGYSTVLRMALFSTKLVKELAGFVIADEVKSQLLYYILLVQEVAKDNLSVAGANQLWKDHEMEPEMLVFTSATQHWAQAALAAGGAREKLVERLMQRSRGADAATFYAARALSIVLADLTERDQVFREMAVSWVDSNDVWKDGDVFLSTAMLVGSSTILMPARKERVFMGTIGTLLGVSSANAATGGLQLLVMLDAALPSADEGAPNIPQPRAMNLIRHLLSWLDEGNDDIELTPGLICQIAQVLCHVLPIVKSMYGEHWQSTLEFVGSCWEICVPLEEPHLPMVSATLRLFQVLKGLVGENDDLDDAWAENKAGLYSRLITLLQNSGRSDAMHQPRGIVNTQIARQLRDVDIAHVPDFGAVYPLLGTQSRPIQKVAFDILHRYIPTTQEQVSVDAALSADVAGSLQLPPEILSMILEAPESLEDDMEIGFAREMPIAIRGYLLSWILVFDHFENASFKVRSIYVESLKEGQYMTPLLDFVSTTIFTPARPFDASKVSIQTYTADTTENPLHDLRWLCTHLYYLQLSRTPSLVKSWWLDTSRNRGTVLAVEAFTEKWMSPLLIDQELASVAEWISTRDEDDEDGMKVKVSKVTREVVASYPVDDQAMDILIRLPKLFPLRQVEVQGLRRVGLPEVKFKQMRLASQAVVNFQSGSITDALTLFRKNVSLHFQGVSECAICYSILAVTPDRSLPNRACATCKNKFHSTCLLKWFKTSNSSSCPLCKLLSF
ncbi:hypothetical protein BZA05DRAFT_339706 [Tricharina praecox]|uniref:uncharacterized protein n=1 Tax=Tricharina praecox TaxID=43433 RepID=UPI00221E9273|nr:uncharacterized protein BZA05DRAFT_339706 [Tricharina praecox]KAI5848931.1 hypothetical protein BZA05DRAFT_339706 [Tricharina praecox]